MLSIIIPSRNEKYLERTIQDLLEKCTGEFEIIAVLDGYDPPERTIDPRVSYIHRPVAGGLRNAVNDGVKAAKGEFLMKIDAHCLVDKGFDEKMTSVCEDNYIVVPRRYRLDADKWERIPAEVKMYVDYEKLPYPWNFNPPELHGFRDEERTRKNADIMIDDTMLMQGSCWVMKKSWFEKNGFMTLVGYGTACAQESSELCFTTWLRGGRVVVNKNTWYAHYRKSEETGGRGYRENNRDRRIAMQYSSEFWLTDKLTDRVHDFKWLLDKFIPDKAERIMRKAKEQVKWTD
jgi:glycosyltransferase involved in cell wall biosynthesis